MPEREWDLERPAMDLLPTSLMCPLEELLARAAAGEELTPLTVQVVEQVCVCKILCVSVVCGFYLQVRKWERGCVCDVCGCVAVGA
jgi:hypothetical protein